MKNELKHFSFIILVILILAGCRESQNYIGESLDCSTRSKITLSAPQELETATGSLIHVAGKIHGQATILVTDNKGASRLERIASNVDLSLSNECHSNLCNIECIPDSGTQGKLKVYYIFESE
jgi:hypothetical protein